MYCPKHTDVKVTRVIANATTALDQRLEMNKDQQTQNEQQKYQKKQQKKQEEEKAKAASSLQPAGATAAGVTSSSSDKASDKSSSQAKQNAKKRPLDADGVGNGKSVDGSGDGMSKAAKKSDGKARPTADHLGGGASSSSSGDLLVALYYIHIYSLTSVTLFRQVPLIKQHLKKPRAGRTLQSNEPEKTRRKWETKELQLPRLLPRQLPHRPSLPLLLRPPQAVHHHPHRRRREVWMLRTKNKKPAMTKAVGRW